MYLFLGVIVIILLSIIAAMTREIGSYKKKLQNRNLRIGDLLRQNLHMENTIDNIQEINDSLISEVNRVCAETIRHKNKSEISRGTKNRKISN
jgi:predicted Holliday junction resolvase-like endonuclease